MNWLTLALGAAMLLLGSTFFWLFTGGVGFYVGYTLAPKILPNQSGNVILIIAIVMGLLGILLAVLVKKVAISIAGFGAGGYILYSLLPMLNVNLGNYYWLVIVAGGIVGAVLAGTMFDWALIILTSACGAMLISTALNLAFPLSAVVLVVLFLVGLLVQGNRKVKD